MKKILMILTNARRDCCSITLDLLETSDAYAHFDHAVFLLNGVSDMHMRFVDDYIARHPGVQWDKILGNGVRPQGIADMQNRCIEKYPDALYMKVDEDVFVPAGWAERMIAAYEAHQHLDNLALITPLIPNNAYGLYTLLTRFYPEYLDEFRRTFGRDPAPERAGFTWNSPTVAQWATRKFIALERANEELKTRTGEVTYLPFTEPFSIGCIAYDYRHWKRMGGIPETDEPGWTAWIRDHGQTNILDCSQVVLHYSFFVQAEWLDRSSLLEDIRRINLPGTLSLAQRTGLTRAARFARQIPGIIRRRSGR